MEKIKFVFDDTKDEVEFFVLEQTKVNGNSYILVTDSEEDEAECLIFKGYKCGRGCGESLRSSRRRERAYGSAESIRGTIRRY